MEFSKSLCGKLEKEVAEDQFLDCRHEDDDLGAEKEERSVPTGVALHDLDVRLIGKLDAEPFRDGLGETAQADGRSSDHRPGAERKLKGGHKTEDERRERTLDVRRETGWGSLKSYV